MSELRSKSVEDQLGLSLQILISAATHALIRDQVQAEPLPALWLKGIARAVESYQVFGPK
jgi:class 3 adenylate cyclase